MRRASLTVIVVIVARLSRGTRSTLCNIIGNYDILCTTFS